MTDASLMRRLARAGFEALARLDGATNVSHLYPDEANAILAYHAVGEPAGYGNISTDRFRRDLDYITQHFTVGDLPAVLDSHGGKRVALTFDDAYDDFYENVFPLLREYNVPATLFVPVEFVGGCPDDYAYRFARSPIDHESFNDPSLFGGETVHGPSMMSWDRLNEVAADPLVTVGTHTRTHPDLGRIHDRETLEYEIIGARDVLEERLGVDVDRFCYPYGRYSDEAVSVVEESHRLAVTSQHGVLTDIEAADRYRLPRVRAHKEEQYVRWDLSGLRWELTELVS
ncbi:polysaccharide deacetylase family protein [Halogeometricum borinquense]|uniref:Polysaccharide deacetylase family protein n=1 Tax=Halogeometricum borinquense TaxID=60847 RepID=A0A6C0UH81_9EURY|nr:polysaccharide deacetylase family protein [Halogeometricum borinquense]QIB73933.1 polysaccharide deacetylase family protein [Halogeometricum borinquense]